MGKKILAFLISALMLLSVCQLGTFAEDWDGTAASSFSGGSGSMEDPYKLSTAGDIALLIYDLDMGNTDYAGVYFEITNDIRMNNETCEFISDTGLVKVSDGKNTAFIGTGIKGDTSGENSLFDETSSKAYYWYASDESTDCVHHYDRETVYGGELHFLHSSYSNGRKDFKGTLDGKNHTVSGAFGYDDGNSAYAEYNGFFMEAVGASIKNLTIEDSLFFGSVSGGFAGYAEDSVFNNCAFGGIVIGIGGIAGKAYCSNFSQCVNYGIVLGSGHAGGIVGINEAEDELNYIAYCDNEGRVICQGDNNVSGGVVGWNTKATIEYCENKGVVSGGVDCGGVVGISENATVSRCNNRAIVVADNMGVGGVVGMLSDDTQEGSGIVKNCTNYGKVISTSWYVGGVVGHMQCMVEASIEECHNRSLVSGDSDVGGIVGAVTAWGETSVKNCTNRGHIEGNNTVGGIVGRMTSASDGYLRVSSCSNQIAITLPESNSLGGIVGILSGWTSGLIVERCYNSGNLTGLSYIGGIVGNGVTKKIDGEIDPRLDVVVENCYNSGDIKANETVGGLVGYIQSDTGTGRPFYIKNSYNSGVVEVAERRGGRLFGYSEFNEINIIDCYFLADAGMSDSCGSVRDLNDNSKELSESEMTEAESFTAFDFDGIWEIGKYPYYKYPTLIGLYHDVHSHSCAQTYDENYHWDECECGFIENKEEHTEVLKDRGDGFSEIVCEVCGAFLGIVENEGGDLMLGDVNNDGNINQYDYILVKRHYFETRLLTDDEMTRADVNSDGKINQYDYILIKRHYFGTYVIG